MSGRLAIVVSAIGLALAAPSAAGASVVLGPANPLPDPTLEKTQVIQDAGESIRFTISAPAGDQITAPFDGVITSWQVYTGQVFGQATVQLKVLKREDPKSFAIVGSGPLSPVAEFKTPKAVTQNVFPVRVPIAAGEIVGAAYAGREGGFVQHVTPFLAGFTEGCFNSLCKPIPSEGNAGEPRIEEGAMAAMNATLEPDADHDGYGDETQEGAKQVTPQGTGPAAGGGPATAPPAAKKKCKKGKKLKRGKCVKKKRKKHHRKR